MAITNLFRTYLMDLGLMNAGANPAQWRPVTLSWFDQTSGGQPVQTATSNFESVELKGDFVVHHTFNILPSAGETLTVKRIQISIAANILWSKVVDYTINDLGAQLQVGIEVQLGGTSLGNITQTNAFRDYVGKFGLTQNTVDFWVEHQNKNNTKVTGNLGNFMSHSTVSLSNPIASDTENTASTATKAFLEVFFITAPSTFVSRTIELPIPSGDQTNFPNGGRVTLNSLTFTLGS